MKFSLSAKLFNAFSVFPMWVLTCLGIKLYVPELSQGWSYFWAPAVQALWLGGISTGPPPAPAGQRQDGGWKLPVVARGQGASVPSPAVGCRRNCAGGRFPSRGKVLQEPLGLCRGASRTLPAAASLGEGLRTGSCGQGFTTSPGLTEVWS